MSKPSILTPVAILFLAALADAQTVGNRQLSPDSSFEYEPNGFLGVESFTYKAIGGWISPVGFSASNGLSATTP